MASGWIRDFILGDRQVERGRAVGGGAQEWNWRRFGIAPQRIPGSIFAMDVDIHFWEMREETPGGRKYSTQHFPVIYFFIYWVRGSQDSRQQCATIYLSSAHM
jgi:hypothetical protein